MTNEACDCWRPIPILTQVVLGVLLGALWAAHSAAQETGSRTIQYSFSLKNQSNRLVEEAEFWTYAPNPRAASQQQVRLTASLPYELVEDDLGNQVLHFTLPKLPPYAIMTISVRAELSAGRVAMPTAPSILAAALQASPTVEATAPEIVQQAKALRADSALRTAENIHAWVVQHVQSSGYAAAESGALATLRNRRGDCTESMNLFVALARAAQLPARGMAGYLHPENGILRPTEFHNWAEFYADGAWQIADPQQNQFRPPASNYIAMRIIGPLAKNPMAEDNRFRFQGEGLAVSMNHQ